MPLLSLEPSCALCDSDRCGLDSVVVPHAHWGLERREALASVAWPTLPSPWEHVWPLAVVVLREKS